MPSLSLSFTRMACASVDTSPLFYTDRDESIYGPTMEYLSMYHIHIINPRFGEIEVIYEFVQNSVFPFADLSTYPLAPIQGSIRHLYPMAQ